MKGGLRINGEKHSRLFTTEVELKAGGVAFYDGKAEVHQIWKCDYGLKRSRTIPIQL